MTSATSPTRTRALLGRVDRFVQDEDVKLGLTTVAGVLAFLIFVGFLYPAPAAILFLGAVLGSLSALTAMGLVLIYRANRIINFAQGDLGALAAVLAVSLIGGPGWGFYPSVFVGLVAALVMGAVIEILFVRRFAKAPRLILTVATIGIAQLLAAGQLGVPVLFGFDLAPQDFPSPLDFTVSWDPVIFRGSHILAIIVVPIAAMALAGFFRFTRIGMAVRASAESSDRALLLGIPVKRIGTLVWVLAAGLSGVAALLRAPIVGVSIGTVLGPGLLLRALAAAVIGRMESLSRTFAAAVVLGMVEQAVVWHTGRTIIVDAVLFFVILGGLLLQFRSTVSRAVEKGQSSWQAISEIRPIPAQLRHLPEIRWGFGSMKVIVAVALVVVPLQLGARNVNLLSYGVILAILALSLLILTGWSGQISLGQWAFAGFGAAFAGTFAQNGWNFFISLAVAGLAGVVVSVLIGLPALRIRGPFLAVATFALALAGSSFFLNSEFAAFDWYVPDPVERILRPTLFGKFDLESEWTFYYLTLIVLGTVLVSIRSLRRSRTGRVLVAARDNERAAQGYGVNLIRARLTGFALAGFYAALAGGLFAYHQHDMLGSQLQPAESITLFSIVVFGGLGSVSGVILGVAWFQFLTHFVGSAEIRLLTTGFGLLIVLLFFPGGLGQIIYGARDAILRWVARRRGIVVPSLLADVRVEDPETDGGDRGSGGPDGDDEALLQPIVPVEPGDSTPDPRHSSRGSGGGAGMTGAGNTALLHCRGVDVSYDKTQVLFGVDFDIADGEIVALLGTNGAGKSTLLSAVCGLVVPHGGSVLFDGRDITKVPANECAALGIVMVPGGRGVFPTLTVEENLELAGWLYHRDPDYLREATDRVLEYFPRLCQRFDQKAGDLSGGEQQMLTLGQAFIARPRLLMIDELSLGLAPVIVEQLLEIVRDIHQRGTTIVLVEQSVNVACTLAERAVFMEKGEVRFDGPTKELLDRPDVLRAVFLQGSSSMHVPTRRPEVSPARRRREFIAECHTCGAVHQPILQVHDIGITFGGIRAVNDVSFSVREGEILGLIGPNGAGKTTIFDLISGFLPTSHGRVELAGHDVTNLPPDARALRGLGRSFQDARLFPSMTVTENLAVALERHIATRDPIAAAVASPATRSAERAVTEQVDELIELMNLQAFADKFVSELSTGSRRVVDLACSLAQRPSVLLLDEPSSGIAQRETEALGPLLIDIRDRTGAALLIVEHDMPLITSISDRLVGLDLGQIIAEGTPDEVVNDPQVVESYLGRTEAVINRSGDGALVPSPATAAGATSTGGQDRRRRTRPLQAAGR